MRYGVIFLWEDNLAAFQRRVKLAENLGYGLVGIGDSPGGFRELGVSLAVAATATSKVALASTVTVPVGRHPVVVASAFASLAELSSDRMVYALGTGGSATASMGLGPTGLGPIRRHAEAVRRLLHGASVEWEGTVVPALRHPRPVPMYLSAYGPAARKLAGQMFDGVILAAGPSPEILGRFVGEVRDAAASAGREPDDVDIWVMSRASVRPDRNEALVDIKANLASAGAFGLRSPAQMATVPEALVERVRELQERYDPTQHVVWDGPNSQLIDELGLTDYLAERFAVVGTPEECRAQTATLEEFGISTLVVPATDRDPDRLAESFAAAVIGAGALGQEAP
jgi:5,10-methylenetetrahydromethanopterin reductase